MKNWAEKIFNVEIMQDAKSFSVEKILFEYLCKVGPILFVALNKYFI